MTVACRANLRQLQNQPHRHHLLVASGHRDRDDGLVLGCLQPLPSPQSALMRCSKQCIACPQQPPPRPEMCLESRLRKAGCCLQRNCKKYADGSAAGSRLGSQHPSSQHWLEPSSMYVSSCGMVLDYDSPAYMRRGGSMRRCMASRSSPSAAVPSHPPFLRPAMAALAIDVVCSAHEL